LCARDDEEYLNSPLARVLSPDDATWQEFLDRELHDVYHLREYARFSGRYEGAEPVAFWAGLGNHAVLVPMLVRTLPQELGAPNDWFDATSPYGYPGPIATHGITPDILRRLLVAIRELARERGIVSAFVRLNPFCSAPPTAFESVGTVVNHGPVVYVDLAKSPDDWLAETRSGHRYDITRLSRLGYSVEMDDWSTYPTFRSMYAATMARVSASAYYQFSDEYFDELRASMANYLHLGSVRGPAGDIAASALFMRAGDIVSYHLSGSAEAHLRFAPSKLMLHVVRQWAKDLGARLLNLGGGFGGKAGPLYEFKAGFSRSQADFHTVRIVCDPERYDNLTRARHQVRPIDTTTDGFFPSYRR